MRIKDWSKIRRLIKKGDTVITRPHWALPEPLTVSTSYTVQKSPNYLADINSSGFVLKIDVETDGIGYDPGYFREWIPKSDISKQALKVLFGEE